MDAFLAKFDQQLAALERSYSPTGFAVAFSGGLDSTVLLALCRRAGRAIPLRALHIDHGLHPQSGDWARCCGQIARDMGVEFASSRIDVPRGAAQSVEAAAREVRYRTLGELLRSGEMLLTAHHEDDQLETVIMRLLRGAGVKGLRGILASRAFAPGYLGRPLLAFSKAELVAAAHEWRLKWIEDPSNTEQRFDRNYLRATVLPLVKARWPAAARTVTRAAQQMSDAEELLEQLAAGDLPEDVDPYRVPLALLRQFDGARQRNLLRYLISAGGLPLPSALQLDTLVAALAIERCDAKTTVEWPGLEARVYGESLYLIAASPSRETSKPGQVSLGRPWTGPEGRIELVEAVSDPDAAMLPDAWVVDGFSVQFRAGGERIKPFGAAHHRTLKKLLQEARIVPWMRSRIPLIYRSAQLVAVGDLWISDTARAELGSGRAWQLRWTEHPSLY